MSDLNKYIFDPKLGLNRGSGYWTKDDAPNDPNSAIVKFYSDTGTVHAYQKSGKHLRSRCIKKIDIKKIVIDGECGSAARDYESDETEWDGEKCMSGSLSIGKQNVRFPDLGKTVNWICVGENGGKDARCTARRLEDEDLEDEDKEEVPLSCENENEKVCNKDWGLDSVYICKRNSAGELSWEVQKCGDDEFCEDGKCENCVSDWCW